MAHHLDEIPVLVMVCAVFADLLITDLDVGRPPVVGGASIFPSVQNLLLACRSEGLGAALTTLLAGHEPKVRDLLGIPPEVIVCATLTVGYPEKPFPARLKRGPISDNVFSERFGEPLFPEQEAR